MFQKVMAQKKRMRQVWTAAGKRLPVTQLMVSGNVVVRAEAAAEGAAETQVHLAFGNKKAHNVNRAQAAQLTKAGVNQGKRAFYVTTGAADAQPGTELKVENLFQPGDVVKVTGITKGLGFTGTVKRWGFSGGPRTHGQSDRTRAPGSIGAGTTPGHVWKGKRMAGRAGGEKQTLETVEIIVVNPADQSIWVKGTMQGAPDALLTLRKNGSVAPKELTAESLKSLGVVEAAPEAEVTEAAPEAPSEEATV